MAERIDFRYNLGLFWGFVKRYKGLFFGTFAFILVAEAVQILNQFLFKVVVDEGANFTAEKITAPAYAHILLIVGGVFVAALAVRSVSKWFSLHLNILLDSKVIYDLKRHFFNHILTLSHRFHTTHKTGSLISKLTRGGRAVEMMIDVLVFNVAPLVFRFAVAGASLLYFDAISGLTIFVIIVTFILYSLHIQRKREPDNIACNDQEDLERANIGDIFTNFESIKYFGKEAAIKRKFASLAERTKHAQIRQWNWFRRLDMMQALILGIGMLVLVYMPLSQFLAGKTSIGTVVFVYTVYTTLMGPMFSFVHGLRNFYNAMADFQSLFAYDKIRNEVKEAKNAKDLKVVDPTIEFNNITFAFRKKPLFESFTLKIPKHRKIALVGHSGSGKSTLVKLLYRLYDVQGGKILVSGQDIKKVTKESLRNSMSIVPQECVLFDDTVYNNIKFSNPDATRKEVMEAIRLAQLDKVIANFPKKEKTIVGERGVRLSGGEKQRVSIARALLADKKILVLDEATSALDSKTEHDIQLALEKLMEGRTTIMIAHRLSTIMKADRIVVLDEGKIVQSGKHDALISRPGAYRKLWELQKGGYIK